MSSREEEVRMQPLPYEPLRSKKPLDRPWPSPIPDVTFPIGKEDKNDSGKILDKLIEIERRLERIEDFLIKKFGPIQ